MRATSQRGVVTAAALEGGGATWTGEATAGVTVVCVRGTAATDDGGLELVTRDDLVLPVPVGVVEAGVTAG